MRAVSVRYDGQVERGRQGAYLHRLTDAAAPVDVGLQHVHRVLLDDLSETPSRVLVLTARNIYGRVSTDLRVAVQLVGHHWLLQPPDVVLGEPVGHLYGVWHVPGTPGVEHDVHVVPDRLPERPGQFQVPALAVAPVRGTVPEEPLGGGVSLSGDPRGAVGGVLRRNRESQSAGVCGELSAGGSAQQRINRLSQRLALQVPESAVHDANRHHGLALATVDHRAVHDVPESLDGKRILADEQRSQRGVYDERLAAGAGAGQSDHAVVGVNLQERGADRVSAVAETRGVVRALFPILRVDVLWSDEPLFPEGVGMLHHAV